MANALRRLTHAATRSHSAQSHTGPAHTVMTGEMPQLSAHEWHEVQQALRTMARHDGPCSERPGPLRRGLSKVGNLVPGLRARPLAPVPAELLPLRDFLCETERHGAHVAEKAHALQAQGYSTAQIAAMALIAG